MSTMALSFWLALLVPEAQSFEFHVAPRQGYTAAPLRYFYRLLSQDAVLWSEMEKVEDLLSCSTDGLRRRFSDVPDNPSNFVLQLGGNDPSQIAQCLKRLNSEGYNFSEVNLNCGCPSIQAGGASTFGASMMKNPELTAKCVQTIRETAGEGTTVSVKTRIAVLDKADDLLGEFTNEQYRLLHNYIDQVAQAGAAHVVLHARPVVLQGLSPIKNRQVPSLNHQVCYDIADEFPSTKITLNGGIASLSQLRQAQQSAQEDTHNPLYSFMAGRWMIRRPLDIIHSTKISKQSGTSNAEHISRVIRTYSAFVETERQRELIPFTELCLPLYLAIEQLREEEENLEDGEKSNLGWDDMDELFTVCSEAAISLSDKIKVPTSTNFKKIGVEFKKIVGKKVHGKWKKNRAEL